MPSKIEYVGGKDGAPGRRSITVDGVRFPRGEPVEVPEKLAKELLSDSERLKGYEFKEHKQSGGKKPDKAASEKSDDDDTTRAGSGD